MKKNEHKEMKSLAEILYDWCALTGEEIDKVIDLFYNAKEGYPFTIEEMKEAMKRLDNNA